ncbi:unnamed protein product [Paramecium primaurelia]|uniref:Uncharacterized protein n=1 Tax=Paramecium primaurelia TaxID=5886 RepID=A0A8S1LHY0_PARPR|nr:unnamed protein product [Paramecium primaurelia]
MNFIKSLFHQSSPQQKKIVQKKAVGSSILDSQFTQVRLQDIKILSKDLKKLEEILKYQPETINEQYKRCYSFHVILSSDYTQAIDMILKYFETHQHDQCKQTLQTTQTKTMVTQHVNQTTQNIYDQKINLISQQNSMFVNVADQIQLFELINQNEQGFMNIYFNYIQRIAQNNDIYSSCRFQQYPYQDDTHNRKLQFLWLFKIINLLNFKLSFIPYFQFNFKNKTQNTLIIRDIAYLIYKDCLVQYAFLRNEITDMLDCYSQYQIKESLQFYELILIMKDITKKLTIFYEMRSSFALNSESVRDVKWFIIEKKQMNEIDNYISKIKLLNTSQFKKSLMVPTQKHVIDNFQKALLDPNLLDNSFNKEPTTAKQIKISNELLYSPLKLKQQKRGEHSRQQSRNFVNL